ncbi:hypothetical protein HZA26_03245 [Candidatus Nomurabacteria bacterium]|nr:hypothetical protein [Candidatus Nomurabacteria bacterium]
MERKILVALLKAFLEQKFNEWGRQLGPRLKEAGVDDSKDSRSCLLDCLEEAFLQLVAEKRGKIATQR